jgi:hypothetical protein
MEPGPVFSFVFAASERGGFDAADFARVQFREREALLAEVFQQIMITCKNLNGRI